MTHEAVIAAACRTPIGRFQGALKSLSAPALGAAVIREALRRAGVEGTEVDLAILGNVLTAGIGQAPARQAALGGGLPESVPAFTVNEVCGSGLEAVMLAAQAIRAGEARVVVAGGQESMSNAPYLLPQARRGFRIGDQSAVDSMIHDGLLDAYHHFHMGETGEIVAERHGVTREEADRFACASHERATRAQARGAFDAEIVAVDLDFDLDAPDGAGASTRPAALSAAGKTTGEAAAPGAPRLVTRDEGIRAGTTVEGLARLKPAFRENGVVTAGNASQISDGAAAVVVMSEAEAARRGLEPLARVVAHDRAATRPEWVMEAPIASVRRLLERAGLATSDIDLFEHNEAFATASCAVRRRLEIPHERLNVNGGAVALGHPIGASGARVLVTLLYALAAHGARRGVATLCLGGGGAVSMLVERP